LEKLRELQKRRYADPAQIDKVVHLDESWRNGEPCSGKPGPK